MTRPRQGDLVIATTLRSAWPSLPALLTASAALCAATTIPTLITPGINPLAVLLYALLAAPFLAGLVAVANTVAAGDIATIRLWARSLGTHALFAIRAALIPAAAAELFLAAYSVWSGGHPLWALPSLALTAAASLVTLLGFLAAVVLGLARPGLRGWVLWITALHLVARRPSRFVAVFSLAGLGLWAAVAWSASLLLLVPGPVVLVGVAAVWSTAAEAS